MCILNDNLDLFSLYFDGLADTPAENVSCISNLLHLLRWGVEGFSVEEHSAAVDKGQVVSGSSLF